jgi:hypothetical protein
VAGCVTDRGNDAGISHAVTVISCPVTVLRPNLGPKWRTYQAVSPVVACGSTRSGRADAVNYSAIQRDPLITRQRVSGPQALVSLHLVTQRWSTCSKNGLVTSSEVMTKQ